MAPLLATVILSTTISNSSTGGSVVSSGGTVQNGSSYSAVSVENYDNDGTGTSSVQIQTDDNGSVTTQTLTQPIIPGVPVDIVVATSTGNAAVSVRVAANGGTHSVVSGLGHPLRPVATTSASTSAVLMATTSVPLPAVSSSFDFASFFRAILSLFHW